MAMGNGDPAVEARARLKRQLNVIGVLKHKACVTSLLMGLAFLVR